MGTVCCVLIIVIIISKISTFVLIADVDRKVQDFVVTEGGIICHLPQKKSFDTVIVLLAMRVFMHIMYDTPSEKPSWLFYIRHCLKVDLGKTLVSVSFPF